MDPLDRPAGAAREIGNAALRRMNAVGMTPTSIRRLSKATPDQLEVAHIARRGNPTQNNWAVDTRRREAAASHPNRQAAIPFQAGTVRNNADPGPWGGLLSKVNGAPKMPRVRQS